MISIADVADALQECCVDPDAKRKYDGMSGGFFWSDEIPEGTATEIIWRLRPILGHRSSMTLGDSSLPYEKDWEALHALCPSWPGFLPERRNSTLAKELIVAGEEFMKSVEALDGACSSDGD